MSIDPLEPLFQEATSKYVPSTAWEFLIPIDPIQQFFNPFSEELWSQLMVMFVGPHVFLYQEIQAPN